jgi:hypothetical protein
MIAAVHMRSNLVLEAIDNSLIVSQKEKRLKKLGNNSKTTLPMLYLCNVRDDRSRSSKGDLSHDKSKPFSAQKVTF